MKRFVTAILVFGLMTGLLFLGLYESRGQGFGVVETAETGTASAMGAQQEDAVDQSEGLKKIALTFDDGPHPAYTEQLLDGLKERGVVVTFFVTGEHAELHPDVIKRMQEDA